MPPLARALRVLRRFVAHRTPRRPEARHPIPWPELGPDEFAAYHGTQGAFAGPLVPSAGGQFGPAIYTTGDPAEASRYAVASSQVGTTPNVRPVIVRLERPLRLRAEQLDGPPRHWFAAFGPQTADTVRQWQAAGYDGVIAEQPRILGVDDAGRLLLGEWTTHYVAFSAHQVRGRFEVVPRRAERADTRPSADSPLDPARSETELGAADQQARLRRTFETCERTMASTPAPDALPSTARQPRRVVRR